MTSSLFGTERWRLFGAATHNNPVRAGVAKALVLFSAVATLSGLLTLIAFDSAPGAIAPAPRKWPLASALPRHSGQELLVFVHPFCGCTKATVEELTRLDVWRDPAAPSPSLTFVVYRPGADSDWSMAALRDLAGVVPHARFVWDNQGLEARRFGVKTSGSVVLYGDGGQLLFHGGITGSRGHQGDNFGLSSLLDALRTPAPGGAPRGGKVFGCAIGSSSGVEPVPDNVPDSSPAISPTGSL